FSRVSGARRERASEQGVAIQLPIGTEHELTGIVDLLHMCAYMSPEGQKEGKAVEIPAELQAQVDEYHTKLLDAVVETDESLMERYLEGEELAVEEVAHALKDAVTRGAPARAGCGAAAKTVGTTALPDLIGGGVPSPAKRGPPIDLGTDGTSAFVFKTIADPFAGRINVFRVLNGSLKADSNVVN